MSSKRYEDIIGVGSNDSGPGTGPPGGPNHLNIDDYRYGLAEHGATFTWDESPLSLGVLPPIEHEPLTCGEICKRNLKERNKKCEIVRKRVAEAMKRAGCPSKITATHKKKT